MKFLVTNDDGIYASGIRALVETLRQYGQVTVVAPNQERSGIGHAITMNRPLRVEKVQFFPDIEETYMIDGTPADCVKFAVEALNIDVDMILSGINIGANLGTDVYYSGTVAAAIEGVFQNIPSLAISLCINPHDPIIYLDTANYYLAKILFKYKIQLPKAGLFNINIPGVPVKQIRGIKATQLGFSRYCNKFEERQDPRGKPYYWMTGIPLEQHAKPEHDHLAVEEKFVSVTPLQLDLTDYDLFEDLARKFNNNLP